MIRNRYDFMIRVTMVAIFIVLIIFSEAYASSKTVVILPHMATALRIAIKDFEKQIPLLKNRSSIDLDLTSIDSYEIILFDRGKSTLIMFIPYLGKDIIVEVTHTYEVDNISHEIVKKSIQK